MDSKSKKKIKKVEDPIIDIKTEDSKNFDLKIDEFDPDIHQDSLYIVGHSSIEVRGGVESHNIKSIDEFYNSGINQIITQNFKIGTVLKVNEDDKKSTINPGIKNITCDIKISNVQLSKPTTTDSNGPLTRPLYPAEAEAQGKNYSGVAKIDAVIEAIATNLDGTTIEKKEYVKDLSIAKIPVVKGSILCNTRGLDNIAKRALGEDPYDEGGYFIVGNAYSTDLVENIGYNLAKIYTNKGYGKQLVRCELISKSGDNYQNTDMTRIIYNKDHTLTVEIVRNALSGKEIPFFLLFRALGCPNDKEMMKWILYDLDDPKNGDLKSILYSSVESAKYDKNYRNIYNTIDAANAIVDMTRNTSFKYLDFNNNPEHSYHVARQNILNVIDNNWLQHIGMSKDVRWEKLKYLGLLIRRTLMVYIYPHIKPTDRDSFVSKRLHAIGENYAKTFKTFYNKAIVQPLIRKMNKIFNETPFHSVSLQGILINTFMYNSFENVIVQAINTGTRSQLKVGNQVQQNRLSTRPVNRKNRLSEVAGMRQVSLLSQSANSASKQSDRALDMRKINPSQIGFVDVIHSPTDGTNVGIHKQLAIFAFIAPTCSSAMLRELVEADPDLRFDHGKHSTPNLTPEIIMREDYGRVYVNGFKVGYVKNSLEFANKYREKRRNLVFDAHTTVCWDSVLNEVRLYVDAGRLCRPLIIVYNNKRDPKKFKNPSGPFRQGIAITSNDIELLYKGKKTSNDLIFEKKIEFITPEEQENCYVCPNLDLLRQRSDSYEHEYTHCEIPQSILGITSLTIPYGHHNPPARSTYQCSQVKQSCGIASYNWPYRMDKMSFLQFVNERPLILTASNLYVPSNGSNIIVMIDTYGHFSVEDGLCMNKSALERGLFDGIKLTYEKVELEPKDIMCKPPADTDGLKNADYSKLDMKGVIRSGEKVTENTVLVGKISTFPSQNDGKTIQKDTSTVYHNKEEAVVIRSLISDLDSDTRGARIALRIHRPVQIGDKFSSRSGQKGIGCGKFTQADMPFTENGMSAVFVFGPHGIPSRMTQSVFFESVAAKIAALTGIHNDGTMFAKNDRNEWFDSLEKLGYSRDGTEQMMSGITGKYIDCPIFVGPIFYQRLQKFVKDEMYSVGSSVIRDSITHQPKDGKGAGGGLRLGEMEVNVLNGHGAAYFINEKLKNHSDGTFSKICRCGNYANVNFKDNIYECKRCGDAASICLIPSSFSSRVFTQEVNMTGVSMFIKPRPPQINLYDTPDRILSRYTPSKSEIIKAAKLAGYMNGQLDSESNDE